MSNYLIINSKDPHNDKSLDQDLSFMQDLLRNGHRVELMLIQDGVYASQENVKIADVEKFMDIGGRVFVDDFSLKLRNLDSSGVKEGVVINSIAIVVEALLDKYKVIWS